MMRLLFQRASLWWFFAIGWASVIFYLSSRSDVPEPGFWLPPHADKIIHALIYSVFATILYTAWRLSGVGRTGAAWLALVVASLYGATDEWHQVSVAGRASDVWDWVADTIGACIVFLLARYEWVITFKRRLTLP